MKTILIYFGHPSQYLFLRAAIMKLISKENIRIRIFIKTKDVLEKLVIHDGLSYVNILPKERGRSKTSVFVSFMKRLLILLPVFIKEKPDLLIGTDATIAILGKALRINRITFLEDDYNVIKSMAMIAYPNTQTILCPEVCDVGDYVKKKIGYAGYMKLGYLHPNVFLPDNTVALKYKLPQKFILIRTARLTAHHDFGAKGLSETVIEKIIDLVYIYSYSVFISSESILPENHKQYQLQINPTDIHHVLSQATLLISDSQSMSVEAAMLGIPSIRYSSFTGQISVLEELEHMYGLTFGVKPPDNTLLIDMVERLIQQQDIKSIFQKKKERMLQDKIDVTAFLIWFIENYPDSKNIMKENPDFQYNFK